MAIGALGGLGVVAFYRLIDLAYLVFFEIPGERLPAGDGLAWHRPILTAAGMALAWWVMRRVGHAHDGMNVPDVQLAVARREGVIPTRPALARTAASAITLGSGGSAGSEGPVAVLGSAVGSLLGRAFQFDGSRVKVLVAAGAAAGISAAFNAPLAGAFFALEEILGSLAAASFPPVVVASVVAAVVSRAFIGNHPAFPIPTEYGYQVGELLLFYPLLGVVAGLAAVLFIRIYFGTEDVVRRLALPPAVLPWLAGLLVGALVMVSGGALVGYGHLAVRLEVFGGMALHVLVLLAVGKMVATSLTLNGGGSGGVFTPSLYIGAATGGAFGVALVALFPGLEITPEAYALVGMAAVVAAATEAPITGILIVFEMTNDYAIVLPLMLTTVIAYLVSRHLQPDGLYSGWLRRRGETIEHGASRDVLAGLRVADAFDPNPQVLGESATLAQLVAHLDAGQGTDFPVVDEGLRLVGMVSVGDIGRLAREYRDLEEVVLAADMAVPVEAVLPSDSLLAAVRKLGVRGAGTLPVVEAPGGRLVGLLDRTHILAAYERALAGSGGGGVSPPDGRAAAGGAPAR